MTQVATAVRPNPPPPALMRLVKPLVRLVLTTRPLASQIGTITLVELRGRRTGRMLRIPVGMHDIEGIPTAFTCRRWRLNLADPRRSPSRAAVSRVQAPRSWWSPHPGR